MKKIVGIERDLQNIKLDVMRSQKTTSGKGYYDESSLLKELRRIRKKNWNEIYSKKR